MAKNTYKKPDPETLLKAMKATGGNLTETAAMLGCSRTILYKWLGENDDYAVVLNDSRKRVFDKAFSTAQAVAFGIPITENGKLVGWQEHPDPQMLRYFMSTLGRDEGFGEEVVVHHKAGKGIDIDKWIELEMQADDEADNTEDAE